MSVRWDAVVDRSRFPTAPPGPAASPSAAVDEGAPPIAVKVWLYGSLARGREERPAEVMLPPGFSVGDVMTELGQRYGKDLLDRLVGPDGRKFSHCRVFVDGLPADDTDSPVHAGSSPAMVEIILLTAIEGG